MNKCAICVLLTAASLVPGASAGERVLFEETFDSYGVKAPGFNEDCRIWEWPPSQKFLAFDPKTPGLMFNRTERIPERVPGWRNYELRFRFKFFGDSRKSFDVRLLTESIEEPGDTKALSIRYADRYQWSAPGLKVLSGQSGQLAEPLLTNAWYEGRIRVHRGRLRAYLDNGELVKLGEVQTAATRTRGFNIHTDTKVVFDYFTVVELSDQPEEPDYREDVCLRSARRSAQPEAPGGRPAESTAEHRLSIPPDANRASASVRVGGSRKMGIKLIWDDDSTTVLAVSVGDQSWARPVLKDGKQRKEREKLPDALLQFREVKQKRSRDDWSLTRHIRPDIACYNELDLWRIAKHWQHFTPASQAFFHFEVRLDSQGVQYWIDGRYAGRCSHVPRLKALSFELGSGGAIKGQVVGTVESDECFLPLDVAAMAVPGAMGGARLPIALGRSEISGIPFRVVNGPESVDIGVVKEHRGSWALECDFYLSRTAFCGIPDTLRMSVPVAQYIRAYALCAVENDPDKVPVLTARLTRFVPGAVVGRGPAIASSSVMLPRDGEPVPPGLTKLGDVSYGTDGKTLKAPLYLVEIPLDVGSIQDVLFQEKVANPYLDIDLIGKPRQSTQQWNLASKPDHLSRSAVHVFGLTLERSPIEMVVRPAQVGNVYYPDEEAALTVTLRPRQAGACTLRWEVSDTKGAKLEEHVQSVTFTKADGEERIVVPLEQKKFGWYAVSLTLTGKAHGELLRHRASFVLQPKDTRRAGYDSPYFTWWFGGAHGTTRDLNVMGPLLARAGLHRTNVKNEEAGAKWQLTGPYLHGVERLYKADDPQGSREKMVEAIRANRKKFPHLKHAMIYHESCGGPFPLELLGRNPQLSEGQLSYGKRKAETAKFVAQVYREEFPDVKLVIGNTGTSVGGLAHLFRNKYPAEYIDFMGEESVCQTIPPEKNEAIGATAYTFWMLRQLALKFGYRDLQPVACYERNYRSNRSLGPAKAAAWNVRDALIVHAWRSPLVPVMGPEDTSYSYYNSVWGNFGMFTRHPQTYPHPGFAAMATLTQVLDQAKFQQQLPTGSLTAYALEFSRDQQNIYAAWVARGEMAMTFVLDRDATIRVTDLWGATAERPTAERELTVRASGEPLYLTTAAKVKAIRPGKRTFPEDAVPSGATVTVASRMADASKWDVVRAVDRRIDNPGEPGAYPPFRQPGRYELRQAKDKERGDCLELELIQEGKVPTIMHEYAFLALKKPAPVPGAPTTVGVWVKGNSGWGQLMWEYEDAEGERWLSCGTGGYGCNIYDWPGQSSINFDGWNFVQFPMTQDSPVRVVSPGAVFNEWQSDGNGNRKIDYPISLTGLMVSMQRKAINLTKMDSVRTVIRVRDLSAY